METPCENGNKTGFQETRTFFLTSARILVSEERHISVQL